MCRQTPIWTFLKSLVAIAIIVLDPFGLSDAAGDQAQSVLTRLAAPYYARAGQDHVAAIVITDDAAEKFGGYPLSFQAHAKVLRQILCMDPAGVFIDLNFRSARGDAEGVAALAEALTYRVGPDGCGPRSKAELSKETTSPVLLAVVRNDDAKCKSIINARDPDCTHMAPLSALTSVTRTVDVTGTVEKGKWYSLRAANGSEPSAAVTLTAALCRRSPQNLAGCQHDLTELEKPLFVRWGYYLSPLSASRYALKGCDAKPSDTAQAFDKLGQSLTFLGRDLVYAVTGGAVTGHVPQKCPYTDQVTIDAFAGIGVNSDPFLRNLIKDRIVVYGADITALPDRIVSPVHEAIAGLFAHAMAVDNLLTMGGGYWKEPPRFLSILSLTTLIEIIVVVGCIWIGAAVKRANSVPLLLAFASAVLFGSLSLAVLWTVAFSYAPLNFVLVSCLTAIDLIVEGPDENPQDNREL